MHPVITPEEIQKTAEKIRPFIHKTPVLTSRAVNELTGAEIFFKCENFQRVGAFKMRGAANALASLTRAEMENGVATHSSGNHAQALALAAKMQGIPAYIVMPENAPRVKVEAVKGYGAEITFCEPNLAARESTLVQVVKNTGAAFVHPFNDYRIIAGQATAAYELIGEVPGLDIIMAPVGGGGLLSGTALSTYYFSPGSQVIAAEPAGADDAKRSLIRGHIVPSEHPKTIADGLLTSLGEKTFEIIRTYVNEILTVTEENIIRAMRLHWERMKIVVEPSGAVPLGALLERKSDWEGKRIGVIISGGNVDLNNLPW
ncbi:MAG: pyridoxal-phosphate dependent enzyme [Bacteroidia bacterium]|nr:pyridoxal-phosphate dependent enzyme [Bacteroidia bacterium]